LIARHTIFNLHKNATSYPRESIVLFHLRLLWEVSRWYSSIKSHIDDFSISSFNV